MDVVGIPMLLGPIFGPILGGWLVDDFSWRWIFFINMPIGVVGADPSTRILPRDIPQPTRGWTGSGSCCSPPALR